HVERIARGSDETLHQCRRRIIATFGLVRLVGGDEHNYIAASRLPVRGKTRVAERDVSAVDRLVDEEPVADEKRRYHAPRGNAIGLDEERAQDEEDRQRADARLEILPEAAHAGLL